MNFDRRRAGLEIKIQLLTEALEKQQKARDGKIHNLFSLTYNLAFNSIAD